MNKNQLAEDYETIEWRLLVYLCKLGFVGRADPFTQSLSADHIDWNLFAQRARLHRVISLVHQGIAQWEDKHLVPQDTMDLLGQTRQQQSYKNMDHAKEMVQIVKLLAEKGVEAIPYKGVVLGQEAYGDIGIRKMSDIDLLVNLSDFSEIREVLLTREYVPAKHVPKEFEATFFRQNFEYNFDLYDGDQRKYHVEPHWKIGFRRWQTDLDFDDIKPLTVKKDFFGTEINMLTPEGLLLTTCLHHGGEDRWNSLKYICDVAAILFKFEKVMNWPLLLREVDKYRVTNIVLLGIGAAVSCFNAPIAEEIKPLISSRKIDAHVQKVNQELRQEEQSANINTYFKDVGFHFSLRKSPVTKLKVLYYHFVQVFTPTIYDINDEKSTGKKYWWLFVTRPFRIWRTHIKAK